MRRQLLTDFCCWCAIGGQQDHFCISGLLYSPMPGLSLRTLKIEDRYSHLCYFRVVVDAQCYISTFSLDIWCFRWIILHGYDSVFYMVLWLLLLLYWFLWHILTCGIMIWRSYLYGLGCILYYVLMSLLWLWSSWSILIGFTLLRENRGSHSHHCFGLLVIGSIISLSSSIHYLPV